MKPFSARFPLFLFTAATWFALLPLSAQGQVRGFQPADYFDLVSVSNVAMAPSGDRVAFSATFVVEEDNARRSEIWIQDLQDGLPSGEPRRLTSPTDNASGPVWSPDGSLLAFSSRRGDDPNTVWFLRMDGSGGEGFHIPGVEGMPTWSPDGQWIAFLKRPDPEEEPGARAGWIAPDAITNTLSAERFDGRVITSMRYKRDGVLSLRPHFSTQGKRQVFVVPATGGDARQVTFMEFNVGNPVWAPDSQTLFFSGNEFEDDEGQRELTGDLWAVPMAGGTVRRLTQNPGSESSPALGPQGTRLAFLSTPARGEETDLLLVNIGADGAFRGQPVNLTEDWDLRPGSPVWSADGTSIRFQAGIGGNRHLFRVPVAGGAVEQVTAGERQLGGFSFSDDDALVAFTATDAVTPTELYVGTGDGTTERRATGFNDGLLDRVTLRSPERLTWEVEGGIEVEGWLVPPVDFTPGGSYPMILKIHGGPHSAYGNTFFPTFHVLSEAGFFVLYTNPRGSSNYGHEFMYATRGEWGLMDREDYLTGVETALAAHAEIDPDRLGVSGGSYGGFMTNWLTATTDRFAAAATSRSITNWESWWGTSDAQGLTEYEFYGTPWERRDLYRRLSPISYVENVTAPTLIIHSENDYRTPIGDGEQWFMSLKKRGVPVEMVRYPRSSHGLSRTGEPWLLVDRLERISSWFRHWLIENPPTPRARALAVPEVTPVRPLGSR
jgi:dipeptidyl aminopeptidase/acylaminoacyl peptidase